MWFGKGVEMVPCASTSCQGVFRLVGGEVFYNMEWNGMAKEGPFLSAFLVRALAKGNEILWLAGTAFRFS